MKTLTMNEVEQVSGGFVGGFLSFGAGAFTGAVVASKLVGVDLAVAGGLSASASALFALPTLPYVVAGALAGGILLNAIYNAGSSNSNNHPFFL